MQGLALYHHLSHPNVVQYLGSHYDDREGCLYIFLEFVGGDSLANAVARFGRLSEAVVRSYVKQVLLGLVYLHSQG